MHLRVVCAASDSPVVREALDAHPGVAHVVVVPRASHDPEGDLIEATVAREEAHEILHLLLGHGVAQRGEISLTPVETLVSRRDDVEAQQVAGVSGEAMVWDELLETTGEDSQLTPAFLLFLTIACLLAAAGVITDSTVTIVGAMVVSPDFGPLAALAVGTVARRRDLVRRGVLTLCVGFLVAIAATALLAVLAHSVGLLTPDHLVDAARVDFVYQVGPWSLIVALLAGVAGMVALTSNRSGPLIGVFISVTTTPAAGFAALAAFYADWERCGAGLLQLVVNLAGVAIAGAFTLHFRRHHVERRRSLPRR